MLFHGYYQLHDHPRIISTWDDQALAYLRDQRVGSPTYLLLHLPWNQAVWHRMLRKKVLSLNLFRKGIKLLLFSNSAGEEKYRRLFGIDGTQCSAYIYTDEKEYSIRSFPKKYDAIYTAQLQPFKRIELASEVEKLYILTYTPGQKENQVPAFCPAVSHAAYNKTWVDYNEKNQILNESRVGLCLSEEEGPMLASLEYLLAGLPVVSTASSGGRDEYYTPENSLIVAPDPAAVKKGVQQMINTGKADPGLIRQKAIDRLQQDRRRYIDFICNYISRDAGQPIDPDALWQRIFAQPKACFRPLPKIAAS